MTIDQIIEQEKIDHAAYEARTIITAQGETIADLRKVFDAVCNPEDWKAPWAASVHHSLVGPILRAVEFFHADRPVIAGPEPITGRVLVSGKGYQA